MTAALEGGEWSQQQNAPAVLYPQENPVPNVKDAGWAPRLV